MSILEPVTKPLSVPVNATRPFVVLVVGVNGTGKTTTIGKLARRFQQHGRSVMLAAGDTFRAAAVEQLETFCSFGSALGGHLLDAAPHLRLFLMGLILLIVLRFSPRGLIPERTRM